MTNHCGKLETEGPCRRLLLAACLFALSAVPAAGQATGPQQAEAPAVQGESAEVEIASPGLRFDIVAGNLDHRVDRLLDQMTLEEKIGQLVQLYPHAEKLEESLANRIRAGRIGSIFYPGDAEIIKEAQRIAVEESRLGIPLLVARDVVHGLKTIFPIPLGQAATWDPQLVEAAAIAAAEEARSEHIDWTFAPMVDVCRDARWGRIAETLGEDPLLAGDLAAAMVRGFQQEEDGRLNGVIACAKHFAAYGFSEGGRDYNRVSLSPVDLHNTVLPPFRATVDAGCRTLMTTFSEVNGIPGTAHEYLLQDVLRERWRFSGFVVSDWGSVTEMVAHGYSVDNKQAAEQSLLAGVDMDMCSPAFPKHLANLVHEGRVPIAAVDEAVRRILRCKAELNFDRKASGGLLTPKTLDLARKTAAQSVVLMKNGGVLPLEQGALRRVAVIGPMADAPKEQLGTWSLDGVADDSVTPLVDLRDRLGDAVELVYVKGARNTHADDDSQLDAAAEAAAGADVALVFVGEDAVLSGEARCRTTLDLPGVQRQLVAKVAATGTPTVVVLLAGRPLTFQEEFEAADAVMFAWHPGTMAGPAINDLLLGHATPSGKLPVTFPRSVGQTPIYYNHPNTGRPAPVGYRPLVGSGNDDLPGEHQYRSHYLDEELGPWFPFGYGLSYTTFEYSSISVDESKVMAGDPVTVGATLTNTGDRAGEEVVQLYVRDRVASSVRPVRELAAYRRVRLEPGASQRVEFTVEPGELAFRDRDGRVVLESGMFDVWIGGDSQTELGVEIEVTSPAAELGRVAREPSASEH